MGNQLSVFDNEPRITKLNKKKNLRLLMEIDEPKEYLTAADKVAVIVKKRKVITGVGLTTYYQVNFEGKVLEPYNSAGVKQFLKNH
jgi:hypothetical protein